MTEEKEKRSRGRDRRDTGNDEVYLEKRRLAEGIEKSREGKAPGVVRTRTHETILIVGTVGWGCVVGDVFRESQKTWYQEGKFRRNGGLRGEV